MPEHILRDGTPLPYTAFGAGPTSLLFVPAIFGLDPGTLELAEAIAAAGATVWVYDPFFRTDPGVVGFNPEGFQRGMARALDLAQAEADQAELLAAMPGARKLVLGVCFGGRFTLLHTAAGRCAGGATFHGGGLQGYTHLAEACAGADLTMHFGETDRSIPPEAVAAVAAAFGPERVVLHPGVGHGFAHPGSTAYSEEAGGKALAALIALL